MITNARHPQAATRVLGWGFSAAAVGAAVTPWVLGRVADEIGIGSVAAGLAAAGTALVAAAEVLLRRVDGG